MTSRIALLPICLAITCTAPQGAWSAPGDLDPSFGTGGQVITSFGNLTAARAIVRMPDGRLVAAGPVASASGYGMGIARYLANGNLDSTFSGDGRLTEFEHFIQNTKIGLAVQADGKVLTAATAQDNSGMIIRRYDVSGAPDASFAGGGRLIGVGGAGAGATTVAIQADGKIVVGGFTDFSGTYQDFALVRLNTNGTFDTSFGVGGIAVADSGNPRPEGPSDAAADFSPSAADIADDFAILPDGSFVMVGSSLVPGSSWGMTLARFRANGTLDTAFGNHGWYKGGAQNPSPESRGSAVGIDADGAIVFAACCTVKMGYELGPRMFIGRMNPNGLATPIPYYTTNSRVDGLRVQPDGRILVSQGDRIWRFLANLKPDPHFAQQGILTPSQIPHALALQPDGFVVAAGESSSSPSHFALTRFDSRRIYAKRGDLTGDARPDIYLYRGDQQLGWVWEMQGAQFVADSPVSFPAGWERVGMGDFAGRGDNLVTLWNAASGDVQAYLAYNDFLAIPGAVDPVWKPIVTADMNRDGFPDLIYRNQETGTAFAWFLESGPLRGDSQFLFSVDPVWELVTAIDFNGDGWPDFLFRNRETGLAFVWEWDGADTGADHFLFSIDPVWEIAHVADWNEDGKPDLVFRNRESGVVFVWYMDGYALAGSDFLFQVDPVWKIAPP